MTTINAEKNTPIPCLPGFPFVGNIFALRYQRLQLLLRMSQQFGDIGAFHFGPRMVPLLNSPDLIRSVLVDQEANFEKTATVRALAVPVVGNGIFLSEGEQHRQQRRLLAPLFQHRRVLSYAQTIVKCTEHLLEQWKEGATILLANEMRRLTLWIISQVLFGADISGEERQLGEALTDTFRYFTDAITNPIHLPQSWPTPRNRQARQALAQVNATSYRMIEERRQSGEERNDFLSLVLHAQQDGQSCPLSDQEIRDEALSLFVAGHETIANALTWCWYVLSQHSEISARMRAEGDRVLAGRLPTAADLPHLPYTLQVLKEALRLYPPVYAFTRRAISPIQLGNYQIPKDTSVVISPYTLHRRPSLFPEPECLEPERFAPEQERNIVHYRYIPFGAGPHICLGMHFALLEGHLILAALAQRLTFEFVGTRPVEPEPLLTLRPKGGVPMRVRWR